MVTVHPPHSEEVTQPEINNVKIARAEAEISRTKIARESRPEPVGDAGEREIGGKTLAARSTKWRRIEVSRFDLSTRGKRNDT